MKHYSDQLSELLGRDIEIWEGVGWFLLFCSVVGFIVFLAWLYKEKRG